VKAAADTAKGDPHVMGTREVDRRKVEIALGNCSRVGDEHGQGLFMPDLLRLEWMNGRLIACNLSGRRLRADGGSWLDERRGQVNYTQLNFAEVSEDTPDWVLRLIKEYQP